MWCDGAESSAKAILGIVGRDLRRSRRLAEGENRLNRRPLLRFSIRDHQLSALLPRRWKMLDNSAEIAALPVHERDRQNGLDGSDGSDGSDEKSEYLDAIVHSQGYDSPP
jgi:hypothetical protein